MYKGVGVRFADLSHFLKYLIETKLFHFHRIRGQGGGIENKLFHFHRIRGREGGSIEPPELLLDLLLPLQRIWTQTRPSRRQKVNSLHAG